MTPLEAIYLHLPFCAHICPFCAFSVRRDDPAKHSPYLKALEKEWAQWGRRDLDYSQVKSLYFGGGTPSRLTLDELSHLLALLLQRLPRLPLATSIEVNPEDVTKDYAQGLWNLGFRRVSIGMQSLQARLLEQMERGHSPTQNLRAYDLLRQAGFAEVNIDLLFGVPGQSESEFQQDLQGMIALRPDHFSLYLLNLEERTKIAKRPAWRNWLKEEEENLADWYLRACEQLEQAGLRQYEVSNFALLGKESLQNCSNWERKNYLALGQGAQGWLSPRRYGNHPRWVDYHTALNQGRAPWEYSEKLTPQAEKEEELMIGLRRREGLSVDWLHGLAREGKPSWPQWVAVLRAEGLAEQGEGLKLSRRGLLVADEVALWLATRLLP